MVAVVIVAVGGMIAVSLTAAMFLRYVRAVQHEHVRREQLLVNQLLHAAGKPWQESPADEARRPRFLDLEDEALLQASPEQYDPVL